MDENKNDSYKQPEEIITPNGEVETDESSSASETPETPEAESPPEQSTDSTPDTDNTAENQPEESGEDSPEDSESASDDNSDTTPTPETEETESTENPEVSEAPAENTDSSPETPEATDRSTSPAEVEPVTPAESREAPAAPTPETPPSAVTPPTTPEVIGNTPASPSIPTDDVITTASSPKPSVSGQPDKKKMNKVILIVVVVVVIALVAILVAVMMGNKTKTTPIVKTSTSSTTMTPTAKTDVWTGKANTYAWDTATNWSLGIPANGDNLEFSVAAIKQSSSSTAVTFQDNIPNLTVGKITISGTGVGFDLAGDPLTITDGIAEDITLAKGNTNTVVVEVANSLTFMSKEAQAVSTGANNRLNLNGAGSTTTIGSSTVQFLAAKSSDIEITTPLSGSGEIVIPASTTTMGIVDFNTASPDFTGNVMVNSGGTVGMGNQNNTSTGVSTTDAFGTANITIASGAYLEINEIGSSTFTIPNMITVNGNGGESQSSDNGAFTGAISACITSAESGCSDGATITFTGKVTLTGNAEFGAFYGLTSPQVPPSATATYILSDLITNNHTLTAVPNSKAVVQISKSSVSNT